MGEIELAGIFWSNHPAGGNARSALEFTIGHHRPGVPQPGRYA
jgi:hypothetical protein